MSLEEYNSFKLEKVLVELSIVDVTLNLSNLDSIAIDGDESFELVQIEGCEGAIIARDSLPVLFLVSTRPAVS
jgi:hypothetical protein